MTPTLTEPHSIKYLLKSPVVAISSVILLIFTALMAGTLLIGHDPTAIHVDAPLVSPSLNNYWLGTDDLGRDLMARLAVGGSISLLVGLATAAVAVLFGGFYGLVAAMATPTVRLWMMRALDVLYSLPGLVVVVLLSVWLGRSWWSLVLSISLFFWPDTARVVNVTILQLKQLEYMQAFTNLGGGGFRWLTRYILPNMLGVLILSLLIIVPRAILTESTLSFIGLGVEPPFSSWGSLASEGWQLVRVSPHILLLSGGCIVGTMLLFNLLGEGVKAHLDPLRKTSQTL